ncbi:hypothetical protein F4677DRAFT_461498 [Hypoxylon crocopeplum]|nr:hypothetical protein F4677DRAFT_461498 [Hypoxylon crocopeplum]
MDVKKMKVVSPKVPMKCRPFLGKSFKIRNQYELFWSRPGAKEDVEAYLNKTENHVYQTVPKGVQPRTPFTEWKGANFGESENALIIGNHASFYAGQYKDAPEKAGMSMIHVLAIPKANIFNGVSLDKSNVFIINEMINLFKHSWEEPGTRKAMIDHQLDALRRRNQEVPDTRVYGTAIKRFRELEAMANDIPIEDFTYGFHLFPDNSVGHLHMHIFAFRHKYRRYSTYAHDDKTIDALEVRSFVTRHREPQPEVDPSQTLDT